MIGKDFLIRTLNDPLQKVLSHSGGLEIDPNKIGTTENIEQNVQNFLQICTIFLNSIHNSIENEVHSNSPSKIHTLCFNVVTRVVTVFPDSAQSVLGGLLFLRFLCPIIVAPDGLQIIQETLSAPQRRGLVLVSSTLQRLANGTRSKDAMMTPVNNWITEHEPIIHKIFDLLKETPLVVDSPNTNIVTMEEINHQAEIVYQQSCLNREKIIEMLQELIQSNCAKQLNYDPSAEFIQILEELEAQEGKPKKISKGLKDG